MEIVFQLRQLPLAERQDVGDEPHRRPRRVDVRAARDVFLEDVVLNGSGQRRQSHALPLRHRDVQRQQDDRRGVDRHRRRDAIERDPVEERGHVVDRSDRHADASDLAGGQRVVRVVPDLRRQIERDAEAADALRQQIPIARVRFLGRCEARVLPHRPQPAAIHGRVDPARERELSGEAKLGFRRPARQILGCARVVHRGIVLDSGKSVAVSA